MQSTGTAETEKFTRSFAKHLPKSASGSFVLGLVGELGTGKTFFVGCLLKSLGVKDHIISPTFVLIKEYAIKHAFYNKVYHIDTYRITHPQDLLSLGFKEIVKEKKAIVIIEWADKVKKLLPRDTHWITFKHGKRENERTIKLITKNQ